MLLKVNGNNKSFRSTVGIADELKRHAKNVKWF